MKAIKYFAIIIFLVVHPVSAQTFWNKISGSLGDVEVTDLCLTQNGILLAYIDWDGLYYTTNDGIQWIRTNYQWNEPIAIETINDSIIITGGYTYVKVSTDTGKTWLTTEDIYVFSLYYEPTSQLVYLGSNAASSGICGIYLSSDFGQTWTLLYSFPLVNLGNFIKSLYVSKTNQIIFASISHQGPLGAVYRIYKSVDHGQNWEIIYEDYYRSVSKIIEDVSSNLYALAGDRLLVSEDEGTTWTTRNIPYSSVLASDYSGRIYRGLFYSTDKGVIWIAMPTSGLQGGVSDMVLNQNNRIYIGNSNGVYFGEADSIVVSLEKFEPTKSFHLSQNYPNPFNPSTNIQYAVSSRQFVTLKVYDILGNEIATLVNGEKPAGNYEVEFDGSGLSSGIYFYQLKAGNYIETKKMILLK